VYKLAALMELHFLKLCLAARVKLRMREIRSNTARVRECILICHSRLGITVATEVETHQLNSI